MALDTSAWLNLRFVEKVLRKSEGDNSIQVMDIFSKPATNKGDNYTSDMFRITIEFSRDQSNRKITEKRQVIFKLAPTTEGIRKDLITRSGFFESEMTMMMDTLEKMNKLLGHERRLSAKGMYVQKEYPMLLMFEDLTLEGYRMADRQAGLDLAHCILALRGLARFHASSVAVCEKEPSQKESYTKGIFNKEHPVEMHKFFISGTKVLAAEVENWPGLGKRYAEKIELLADHIYQIGIDVVQPRQDEFKVINHGDFWVNNMMFKYNDEDKPIKHICVDFQLGIYTSPAIDLLYFLSTSPSMEVIENNKEVLLDEYLNTLTTTMKELNCKTQPPTKEQLKNMLKEKAAYGMIAAFTVLPLVLCDSSKVKDIDEIMSVDGTYENPGYKGETYRNVMIKRIPMYDEMGLLDF